MKSRLAFSVVLLAATPKTKNLALRTYFFGQQRWADVSNLDSKVFLGDNSRVNVLL